MSRFILPLSVIILCLAACAPPSGRGAKTTQQDASAKIVVAAAKAAVKEIPSSFQATGSFIAEETSGTVSGSNLASAVHPTRDWAWRKKNFDCSRAARA